jgi:hypothetical protein
MTTTAQPELLGIPPPLPDAPLDLAIAGVMEEPAEVRVAPDGTVNLLALVAQRLHGHPHALPALAVYRYCNPDAHDRALAEQKARWLTTGAHVVVRGSGLEIARHHGRDVLRLVRCAGVLLASELAPLTPAPQPE